MANSQLPEQLLYLIVRFTAAIPDLSLTISAPHTTTTLSLKRLIRTHLPPTLSSNRLRIIYAGKVLADTAPLSTSLNLPPPPPAWRLAPDKRSKDDAVAHSKGKGKGPARSSPNGDDDAPSPLPQRRVYIHCSIGDVLSASDLAAEASAAAAAENALTATSNSPPVSPTSTTAAPKTSPSHTGTTNTAAASNSSTSTAPAPQGFDRLLTAGFTPAEISALRSQFLSNLRFTHTPDTLPTGAALRRLENSWLDSSAQDQGSASAAEPGELDQAGGGEGWGAGFGAEEGGLDDMLWGNVVGFFWPLGAVVWGCREEGVWTRRRQIAVATGVLVNLVFGFLRLTS
ncbi:hypothetical protein W97_03808 [Coniosporium apollinis CBS 100218]|uniref:Ubiquitin-like domain-containing protein n=1 Tax=Coniosporium apollinis (strain CBS 100218) TaxID=1168221 RepID=R7YRP6_CONA1|nr:uncharacterized protein W97_03808 [Coniosporium apollinis CBS 100218]EON64575.1 hypothetical protein W97_03808 [Coniosporium apollinis CBS 100218]